MLTKYTLTQGYWKKISNAGETGVAWLKSANGFKPSIIIAHTDSVQNPVDDIPVVNAIDLDIDVAYRLPKENVSEILTADNINDIFYATILNSGKTVEIIADFVEV